MSRLINFRIRKDLESDFEKTIRLLNEQEGRGPVILHGDKTRYLNDAVRVWMEKMIVG